jgi:hypothetical protein
VTGSGLVGDPRRKRRDGRGLRHAGHRAENQSGQANREYRSNHAVLLRRETGFAERITQDMMAVPLRRKMFTANEQKVSLACQQILSRVNKQSDFACSDPQMRQPSRLRV